MSNKLMIIARTNVGLLYFYIYIIKTSVQEVTDRVIGMGYCHGSYCHGGYCRGTSLITSAV